MSGHQRVWPGTPYPLGATWDGEGTNFSIFSEHATSVELCLFDHVDDGEASHTIDLGDRYPRSAFFDTPDHLNEAAQIIHSQAVAAALAAILAPARARSR